MESAFRFELFVFMFEFLALLLSIDLSSGIGKFGCDPFFSLVYGVEDGFI